MVACWYAYLDLFVPSWDPYEPSFRTIGSAKVGHCAAELQSARHERGAWYQVRLEPTSCWNDARRAWLVVGEESVPLSGGKHRFRAQPRRQDSSILAVTLEIERWDSTRETTVFRP